MSHTLRMTARLVRLYLRNQRVQIPFFVSNAILFPATILYLGLQVSGDDPDALGRWMVAAVTLALGQTVVNHVGFMMLEDRFMGRAELLRAWPVDKATYCAAHLTIAVLQGTAIVVVGVLLLGALGLAPLRGDTLLLAIAVSIGAGSTLGGLAAVIATRIKRYEGGPGMLGLASLGLALASPIAYDASLLPTPLQLLSWLSPYTHVSVAVRATLDGAVPVAALAAIVVMSAVLNVIGYRAVRW